MVFGVLHVARARDRQSGAVEERAQQVHPAYIRHARVLDRRLHPAGSPTHRYPHGPVEQVILDHADWSSARTASGART